MDAHILVIRLSAMGDVAMTVPVLRAFTEQNPNIKITVLSKGFLKPLFDDIKNVDFHTVDVTKKHKGFIGLWKLFNELKLLKITQVADLHDVLRSKTIRTFFKTSGFNVAHINKGRVEKKALTRTENKIFKQLKTSHQRYADVFMKLGFSVSLLNPTPIKKYDLPQQTRDLIGTSGYKKWIGIAPFATYESKTYPLELMEQVIKELSKKNKYQLFLFGGKNEAAELDKFQDKYENVISTAGKLGGLKNEINLISNLDLMLSMDSGNAHLSAMQNIKTVTIWGGTHPYAGFAPFYQPDDFCILPDLNKYPNLPCSIYGNKTIEGYENVMKDIKPETIIKKITTILNLK